MIPEVTKVGYKATRKGKEPYDYNVVDNRFQVTVKINSILGKIEAF